MADPMEKIFVCLSELCPDTANRFRESFKPKSTDPKEQLHEANNFLRVQLGLMDHSTTKVREHLIDNLPISTWLRGFKEHVAPTIVKHGLTTWTT